MCLRGGVVATLGAAALIGIFQAAVAAKPFVTKAPTVEDWITIAKRPDFTGVWEVAMGPPPAAKSGKSVPVASGPAGLPAFMRPPQLKLTPAYEARRKQAESTGAEESAMANCVPPGMPQIMGQPYPMEFLMTPGKVTIVTEAFMQVRHIYTDGRPLPVDPDPAFNGHSIGHWEGDTLVVETVAVNTDTFLTPNVSHGPNMKIIERFRLSDPNTMVIDRTVTDPDALAEPWTSSLEIRRHREYTTTEYVCQQNNRNFMSPDGKAGITLSNP